MHLYEILVNYGEEENTNQMKPSEIAQINFIADCIRKGEQRKEILAKFVKKWQNASQRTFDRRLRQAEAHVASEQARIKEQAEERIKQEADALKAKILTSLERQVILSEMAKGELETEVLLITKDGIKKAKCKPDHADIKNAIAELNKMDGSYSPTKVNASVEVIKPNLPDWMKSNEGQS